MGDSARQPCRSSSTSSLEEAAKDALYEGHGFSRAVTKVKDDGFSAEVRFYAARKAEHVPQPAKEICGLLLAVRQRSASSVRSNLQSRVRKRTLRLLIAKPVLCAAQQGQADKSTNLELLPSVF
jgi:hypothetical protein